MEVGGVGGLKGVAKTNARLDKIEKYLQERFNWLNIKKALTVRNPKVSLKDSIANMAEKLGKTNVRALLFLVRLFEIILRISYNCARDSFTSVAIFKTCVISTKPTIIWVCMNNQTSSNYICLRPTQFNKIIKHSIFC
jgi:hypothetical protein